MLSARGNNAFDDAHFAGTKEIIILRKMNFMEESR
jgi:hypothetical protein